VELSGTKPYMNGTDILLSELMTKDRVGGGAFGDVYYGEWRGVTVAIKKIKGELSDSALADFRSEVKVMQNLKPHPHIIQLLGAHTTDPKKLCLVTEYFPNGSLDAYLKRNDVVIDIKLTHMWARGICLGMIHLSKEGIVHRDLAARNVLLDESLRPKISDFGLARFVSPASSSTTKTETGPVKWTSPESLNKLEYSEKSDVWSYGVVLYEIIFRREPYPGLDGVRASIKVASGGHHPDIPEEPQYSVLANIMNDCFQFSPEYRPTFASISKNFGESYSERSSVISSPTNVNADPIYN